MAVFLLPWVILPAVVLLALNFLQPYVSQAGQFLKALDAGDVKANFALSVGDAVASFGLIAIYIRRSGARWSDVGFRTFNILKIIFYVIGLFISLMALVFIADYLLQHFLPSFNAQQPQVTDFDNAAPAMQMFSLIALVILPPIVEETVFRGFIFPAFSKRSGLVAGAIGSSMLFGFAHLQPNIIVYTFILGLLLCWLYTKTGSIIPGMFLHMLNNYIAYSASHR